MLTASLARRSLVVDYGQSTATGSSSVASFVVPSTLLLDKRVYRHALLVKLLGRLLAWRVGLGLATGMDFFISTTKSLTHELVIILGSHAQLRLIILLLEL